MTKDSKEVAQRQKRGSSGTRSTNSAEGEPAAKKKHIEPHSLPSPTSLDINGVDDGAEKDTMDSSESAPAKVYDENYWAIKAKQKAAMERPKLFLTRTNVCLSTNTSTSDRGKAVHLAKLSLIELQTLVIFALRRGRSCTVPGWCCLKRPGKMSSLVLIVLGDVSATDFQQNQDCFSFVSETFKEDLRVRLVSPSSYFSSFDVDMYAVPQTKQRMQDFVKHNGQTSLRNGKKVVFPVEASFPLPADTDGYTRYALSSGQDNKSGQNTEAEKDDAGLGNAEDSAQTKAVSPLELLLSPSQMVEEKYPVPDDEGTTSRYQGFVYTKKQYAPVTKDSPLFALDCEMCLTTAMHNELTRVSLVSEKNEVVYDELVKPYNGIINYLTRYSGITKKMLDPVTKRIEDVQREIGNLLPPDAILCGQSLGGDLNALKLFHPYVIDTSVIYNLSGSRRIKCGLKRLSWHFLGKVIQNSKAGHCSSEDASATMDLVNLKLSKGLEFGDTILGGTIAPSVELSTVNAHQRNTPDVTATASKSAPKSSSQQTAESGKVSIMMRSLFDFFDCRNIAACMIGQEKLVTKYQEEPGLRCVATSSDKLACKEARKAAKDVRFTWVQFAEFAELLKSQDETAEEKEPSTKGKKAVFRNLDKRVKKLVKKLQEKCLVAAVMPGRSTTNTEHMNAAAFFHIT